jgi:hypothetical protein
MTNEWTDVVAPKSVEIVIDHDSKRIWINVDGVCTFRAYRIEKLAIDDRRLNQDTTEEECKHDYRFRNHCGAYVCTECDDHRGLARCYCGWSKTSSGRGYEELAEMGETIEPEDY